MIPVNYFDAFETAHAAAEMWRSGIRASLGVGDEVTLPECQMMIESLRAQDQPASVDKSAVVLALAACFAQDTAREALEHAAWTRPWALRVCPAVGVAPITRARVTVAAFTDPTNGWGERNGLRALLAWAAAPDVVGGPIVALRREITTALEALGPP